MGCGNLTNKNPSASDPSRLPECPDDNPDAPGCCLDPPKKMACPKTENLDCEKIKLTWEAADSCQDVSALHIQVKKGSYWVDLPKVPPTWTSWEISNNHLRNPPISLKVG